MQSRTFDRIINRWETDASRRQIIGGLLGTVMTGLAGGTVLEAKPKHAARNRRKSGGGGAATKKVAICHVTNGGMDVKRTRVSRPALRAHLAHGDSLFVDCCVNEDCEVPECYTGQCVAGTCSQTQLPPGAPCTFGGGGAVGNCTAAGQCLPTGGGGG